MLFWNTGDEQDRQDLIHRTCIPFYVVLRYRWWTRPARLTKQSQSVFPIKLKRVHLQPTIPSADQSFKGNTWPVATRCHIFSATATHCRISSATATLPHIFSMATYCHVSSASFTFHSDTLPSIFSYFTFQWRHTAAFLQQINLPMMTHCHISFSKFSFQGQRTALAMHGHISSPSLSFRGNA